jgi:hypothetical protein
VDHKSLVQSSTCRAHTLQGKWTIPKIPNPEYKGVWSPRLIANPQFFEDQSPADFTKIGGIGIELWTMTEDILCEYGVAVVSVKAVGSRSGDGASRTIVWWPSKGWR